MQENKDVFNLEDFNQLDTIDMEMDASLLDDDDFGGFGSNNATIVPTKPTPVASRRSSRDEEDPIPQEDYSPRVYGFSMDFGDDENDIKIDKETDEVIGAKPEFQLDKPEEAEFDLPQAPKKEFNIMDDIFGGDFMETDVDPELIGEDLVQEETPGISQGQIENDYYANLQKKHAKSNVKGSINTHFHFSANPEKEKELFNHDMTPNKPVQGKLAGKGGVGTTVGAGDSLDSNPTAVALGASSGGCSESYQKLFEDLLLITGFDLIPQDGKILMRDKYNMNPEVCCDDKDDVLNQLKPYIADYFITPLQYQTKEKFTEPKDWCTWYTPEMKAKYPKCANDIKYCDLLANHINDIKF